MRFVSATGRGLRRAGVAAARAVPPLLRDLVGIAGAASFVFGVWQIYRPAAWLVAGAFMMLVAIRLAAAKGNS